MITEQLLMMTNTNQSNTSDYKIAKYLLLHSYDINKITTSLLAKECDCSKSTIFRFVNRIGYDNFNEFKQAYYKTQNERSTKYDLVSNESMHIVVNNIINSLNHIDFTPIIQDIIKYHNIHIYGTMQSNQAAIHMQYDLFALGKIVDCKIFKEDQKYELNHIKEDDLLIIFSTTGLYLERMNLNQLACKYYLFTVHNQSHTSSYDLNLPNEYRYNSLAFSFLSTHIISLLQNQYK